MKKNGTLQKDIQDAIRWEPLLHAAEIGVIAHDGIVTLTGVVDTYAKKNEAENAAKNVRGVKAVADKIEVILKNGTAKDDTELALEVVNALKGSWSVPDDEITVIVDDGWVTMEGILHWNFQREAAKSAVRNLSGLKGVISKIKIKAEIEDAVEQAHVEKALRRNWAIDAGKILVKASKNDITLSGIVNSLYQKDEAERIAWKTPGVWYVDNQLIVEYD